MSGIFISKAAPAYPADPISFLLVKVVRSQRRGKRTGKEAPFVFKQFSFLEEGNVCL